MIAYHNSRIEKYKSIFGAIPLGSIVKLSIDVKSDELKDVFLRVFWGDDNEEKIYKCEIDESISEQNINGDTNYFYNLKLDKAHICWYSFIIEENDKKYYYGPKEGRYNGEGALYEKPSPSFQITVYKERKLPNWYKDSICYQIFPDRFYKGDETALQKNIEEANKYHKNGIKRNIIVAWNKEPRYETDKDGKILSWDFYGGTLKGIEEKLEYLKELGIGSIYLNPIFEAASNHRYDSANFLEIDPLLGTKADFESLCKKAKDVGIHIILDGVFNHVGKDSIYFNNEKNYGDICARDEKSPYHEWFNFKEDGTYDSWWGIDDLPAINENKESYKNFIYKDRNSVIKTWLRAGASGFRLDVADELPEDFIAGIKQSIISEKGNEGLLIGEVWEDASNKVSYGKLRNYFAGDELDAVMNYPLRRCIIEFLNKEINAFDVYETLMSLKENYPKEAFYGALNLLSSHDRQRILTKLGVSGNHYAKLWLAMLMQMTLPGVPCIYYGDEAGLLGEKDPKNRATFPWGAENKDVFNMYKNAIRIRKEYKVFTNGSFEPFAIDQDLFGYIRENEEEKAIILINTNYTLTKRIHLESKETSYENLLWDMHIDTVDGYINFDLWNYGSAVLYTKK